MVSNHCSFILLTSILFDVQGVTTVLQSKRAEYHVNGLIKYVLINLTC